MNIEKCMKKQCDFCKIKDKCFKDSKERNTKYESNNNNSNDMWNYISDLFWKKG